MSRILHNIILCILLPFLDPLYELAINPSGWIRKRKRAAAAAAVFRAAGHISGAVAMAAEYLVVIR